MKLNVRVCVCVLCRNYSVVNVEKGQVEVKRMSCPGSRISCQMKMGNTLWMATEVNATRSLFTFTNFMSVGVSCISSLRKPAQLRVGGKNGIEFFQSNHVHVHESVAQ